MSLALRVHRGGMPGAPYAFGWFSRIAIAVPQPGFEFI
jgi:hypothetical protein